MLLNQWALKHRIPHLAIADLRDMLGTVPEMTIAKSDAPPLSEAAIQTLVRLEASAKGARVWRNNVGAGYLQDGSFMRWGLANDSESLNKALKSADLIGIRPVIIESHMVGHTIGQFISREVKSANWKFAGTARENAQLRWAELIISLGGDAAFCNNVGTL